MDSLIIGAGYVASYLYQQLKSVDTQTTIYTLSRSASFLDNIHHLQVDLDNRNDLLPALSMLKDKPLCIYYLAPPKAEALLETRVQNFIHTISQSNTVKKLIYISTSGVYGNKNGAWVDESITVNPETDRAQRRVSAETQFLALNHAHITTTILRVPGIYGPKRLPIEKIKQRNKIISEDESGYTNLIHVDDLVTVCITAAQKNNTSDIYNVSDTQPIKSSYYYKSVAKLAKIDQPEEVSYATALKTFDKKRLSFLQESRRLDVSKMLKQLQPDLIYTKLEDGILQAIQAN